MFIVIFHFCPLFLDLPLNFFVLNFNILDYKMKKKPLSEDFLIK